MITDSNIEIPEEWIEKIEDEPDYFYLSAEQQKKLEIFIKEYYGRKTLAGMARATGEKVGRIRAIVERLKKEGQLD